MLTHFSRVQLFATLWTVACQAPLSMGFSRQEYWSRLPCLRPGGLPDPGIEPGSPALQADSLPIDPHGKPNIMPSMWQVLHNLSYYILYVKYEIDFLECYNFLILFFLKTRG